MVCARCVRSTETTSQSTARILIWISNFSYVWLLTMYTFGWDSINCPNDKQLTHVFWIENSQHFASKRTANKNKTKKKQTKNHTQMFFGGNTSQYKLNFWRQLHWTRLHCLPHWIRQEIKITTHLSVRKQKKRKENNQKETTLCNLSFISSILRENIFHCFGDSMTVKKIENHCLIVN